MKWYILFHSDCYSFDAVVYFSVSANMCRISPVSWFQSAAASFGHSEKGRHGSMSGCRFGCMISKIGDAFNYMDDRIAS